MEQFISDVDRVVTSTKGHTVRFKAGEPRTVPKAVEQACFAAGIRPASAGTDDGKASGPSVREVATAIREIIESGDSDKLTSQGKVRVEAINAAMGQEVNASVRSKAERLLERGEA